MTAITASSRRMMPTRQPIRIAVLLLSSLATGRPGLGVLVANSGSAGAKGMFYFGVDNRPSRVCWCTRVNALLVLTTLAFSVQPAPHAGVKLDSSSVTKYQRGIVCFVCSWNTHNRSQLLDKYILKRFAVNYFPTIICVLTAEGQTCRWHHNH